MPTSFIDSGGCSKPTNAMMHASLSVHLVASPGDDMKTQVFFVATPTNLPHSHTRLFAPVRAC